MKVNVKILEKTKSVELNAGSTIEDLFKELGENSESYIVKRGNKVIIEKEKLRANDRIELIKIISGG